MADASIKKLASITGKSVADVSAAAKKVNSSGGSKTSYGVSDLSQTSINPQDFVSQLGSLGLLNKGADVAGLQSTLTKYGNDWSSPVAVKELQKYTGSNLIVPPTTTSETPDYYGELTGGMAGLGLSTTPTTTTTTPTTTETPEQARIKLLNDRIKLLTENKTPDYAAEYAKAEKEAGILEQQQRENDLTAQLTAINTKAQQDQLKLRQIAGTEGVTDVVYGAQQTRLAQDAAIAALSIQSELAAVQGKLEFAKDRLNTLFNLKMKTAEMNHERTNKIIDSVYDLADDMQKEAINDRRREEDKKFQRESDMISYVQKLSSDAASDGNFKLASELGKLMNGDTSNLSMNDVSRVLSVNGRTIANTGDWSSVVNGAYSLLGPTKGKQIRSDLNSQLGSGDYAGAYATLGNAVEEALTGTNKTKFSDARTDYQVMAGLRTAIQDYADAGGDMGLLKGTEESIKRKLGIDSGNASALATQLWREFQSYRVNMTGAAFSPSESRDYAAVNPTLGKSLDLNLSVIDGAMAQLENRITGTINARIPGAQMLFDKMSPQTGQDQTNQGVYTSSNGNKYTLPFGSGETNTPITTAGNTTTSTTTKTESAPRANYMETLFGGALKNPIKLDIFGK